MYYVYDTLKYVHTAIIITHHTSQNTSTPSRQDIPLCTNAVVLIINSNISSRKNEAS